ncbi:MAG: protein TolQ [Sulfurimicrobium sp.]|nr:protein TolQ [Sulfurimicrobium sp.]
MNVNQDLSFLSLITNASVVVQLVMLGLLLASMMSWWYIFQKMFAINEAKQTTDKFEREFWSGMDLQSLFQKVGSRDSGGMESIFEGGFQEFSKMRRQSGADITQVMESTRRAMRAAYHRELDLLEAHLPFLATVGSVSPYVGLFGTVWGIMNAFRSLSSVGQATLAHVAPGIAEALIATAMGLFAAIPAVIAYNRYSSEIDRLATRFDSFMEEISNILQRQAK